MHSNTDTGNVPAMMEASGDNRLSAELASRTEERLKLALEAGNLGVWEWDIATGEVTWSSEVYEFFGVTPDEFQPSIDGFTGLIHPADRAGVQASINHTLDTNEPYRVLHRIRPADGDDRWLEGWGRVIHDQAHQLVGMIGLVADVTERVAAEQEHAELLRREREARSIAEAGRQRLTFLTQAFKALGMSLDMDTTTQRVLDVLVPHVGEWAVVYLKHDGQIKPVGLTHRDPDKRETLRSLTDSYRVDESTTGGVGEVIRTGSPVLQTRMPPDLLDEYDLTNAQRQQVKLIGVDSYIVVPLTHRKQTIGAIAVGVESGARPYQAEDLELVEQIADRAAIAFRNAALFEERSRIAKVLQRSLLPAAFPKIDQCEVAAGYSSAGSGLGIGGDFYDLFQIDATRFGLAIGDVSGKGHEAAAVTALTRHTIRATALLRDRPSEVLQAVNEVLLEQSREGRFCTAVYGILEQALDGVRISMALAGHVPPLVARADGQVEEIHSEGVLLGMFSQTHFENCEIELRPGDTLVLYTDGLTDVKVGDGVLGGEWLRAELALAHKQPVADIVRTLELNASRSGAALTDDVAILAIQVPGTKD